MRFVAPSILLACGLSAAGQQLPTQLQPDRSTTVANKSETIGQRRAVGSRETHPGYTVGPGDQITVHVVNVEEINDKPLLVDLNGYIRLPLIGRMQVSGLTLEQVESQVTKHLKIYVLHPDVSVSITEFRSEPISVIGAVRTPGVQQVQGRKTLLQVLSMAGGLDSTMAGSTLRITRRLEWGSIPLPGAAKDPTNQFSVAQVSIKSLLEAKNPEENILIKPYDVISVPRADTVYVIGQVLRAGGYPLTDNEQITVLQALSMAGGLDRVAQPQSARLLRRVEGATERTEIAVNLKKILEGTNSDVRMQADDILFVPNSLPKQAAIRALEAGVEIGTGIAIWSRP